jgi:hypothetical protein
MNFKLNISKLNKLYCIIAVLFVLNNSKAQITNEPALKNFNAVQLTAADKAILSTLVQKQEGSFDSKENMIVTRVNGYQYHTDASSGNYHHIVSSFKYALALLNTGDKTLFPRAFAVIAKTLSLQDTLTTSPTCGVWPYYLEEPLQTKKSPPDYNMADFNAVTLIEICNNHQQILPSNLYQQLEHAILLAANSITKRNVSLGYTNIALMDTYVTYMAGFLLNNKALIDYGTNKLNEFYKYTLAKNGFTEYNSPNYTITALEELNRMQLYFVNQEDRKKVDSLYHLCWQILARHYHIPSGQWTGPHSRSYSSIVGKSFYNLLAEASNGKIGKEDASLYSYSTFRRYKHLMPKDVEHYFVTANYPRTEIDVFEPHTPQIKGTSYLTANYALSSINHASLWNQRRPLIAYWGTKENPKYLQIRFLHDNYDFSSASISTVQSDNKVLAAINFVTGLGDKHILIDRIKDGKFLASDLRLRFEFGNTAFPATFSVPALYNTPVAIQTDQLVFNIQLLEGKLNNQTGYWEKGTDGKTSWIDFVLYKGNAINFNMLEIQKFVTAFTLMINEKNTEQKTKVADYHYDGAVLKTNWENLSLSVDSDIQPVGKHKGWF